MTNHRVHDIALPQAHPIDPWTLSEANNIWKAWNKLGALLQEEMIVHMGLHSFGQGGGNAKEQTVNDMDSFAHLYDLDGFYDYKWSIQGRQKT